MLLYYDYTVPDTLNSSTVTVTPYYRKTGQLKGINTTITKPVILYYYNTVQ